MFFVFISIVIIFVDQLSKLLVHSWMRLHHSITVIHNFFYITYCKNTGAAWGLLQNGRYFLIFVSVALVMAIIYYMCITKHFRYKFALSIILGGAIGNLIDRILRGYVIDFLELRFGSYIFPLFNFADISIVCGSLILMYFILINNQKGE